MGLDDTDVVGTPGTNQLARRLGGALPPGFGLHCAARHQLLQRSDIPYTTRNGAASLALEAAGDAELEPLLRLLRRAVLAFAPRGADPGFCVLEPAAAGAAGVAAATEFGRACQRERTTQAEAQRVAASCGARLEGLAGTRDGVIGALAAVGLRASGDDGRVVHRAGWPWPDHFGGVRRVEEVLRRGVDAVHVPGSEAPLADDVAVVVGRRLRPSLRGGRVILFVEAAGPDHYRALKLD